MKLIFFVIFGAIIIGVITTVASQQQTDEIVWLSFSESNGNLCELLNAPISNYAHFEDGESIHGCADAEWQVPSYQITSARIQDWIDKGYAHRDPAYPGMIRIQFNVILVDWQLVCLRDNGLEFMLCGGMSASATALEATKSVTITATAEASSTLVATATWTLTPVDTATSTETATETPTSTFTETLTETATTTATATHYFGDGYPGIADKQLVTNCGGDVRTTVIVGAPNFEEAVAFMSQYAGWMYGGIGGPYLWNPSANPGAKYYYFVHSGQMDLSSMVLLNGEPNEETHWNINANHLCDPVLLGQLLNNFPSGGVNHQNQALYFDAFGGPQVDYIPVGMPPMILGFTLPASTRIQGGYGD